MVQVDDQSSGNKLDPRRVAEGSPDLNCIGPFNAVNESLNFMKIYHLRQKQFLPVSLQDAWDFFSNPRNLDEITPPRLQFRIVNVSEDRGVYAGQFIRYNIRLLPYVWVGWLTEITAARDREYFIDDQRSGPYALWQHRHAFREVPGGVEMSDEVTYALPFGFLGEWVHRIFVRRELDSIFAYRRTVLEKKFSKENQQQSITPI